jgi:hypothetical protein
MVNVKMAGRSTIQYVVDYVCDNPGCNKRHAASGNTRYGYAAVNRAIRKGLITCTWVNGVSVLHIVTGR